MNRKHLRAMALAVTVALAPATLVMAADGIRTERVQFGHGKSSATITGAIKGDETIDYVLGAAAGQTMAVTLKTNNAANYFNVLPPGSTGEAIFIGSTSGNEFSGTLAAKGDYTVRVYLMRSAARRNETANYTLTVGITGAAAHGSGGAASHDAKVAGTGFHATGEIPCAMGGGQPTGSCAFGVTREGNGSGVVTVTKPDGRTRAIFFDKGRAITADASEADGGDFRAEKQSDLNIIHIGDERYEIPDAVIFGG